MAKKVKYYDVFFCVTTTTSKAEVKRVLNMAVADLDGKLRVPIALEDVTVDYAAEREELPY